MLLTLNLQQPQAQDLRATPHNLARHGELAVAQAEVGELCVFCHAPTLREPAGGVPLWQSSVDATHAFDLYDDVGLNLVGRVGSHSVACLSCHDANQAATTGIALAPGASIPAVGERDHPVGVPYSGALGGPRDPQSEFRPAAGAMLDGKPVWWVPAGPPGARRRRSDLPLFTRSSAEDGNGTALVECGTCHDPHGAAPRFLRLAPNATQLCQTCHAK